MRPRTGDGPQAFGFFGFFGFGGRLGVLSAMKTSCHGV